MSGKLLARTTALSLALVLAACGGDENSTPIINVGSGTSTSTDTSDTADSGETETDTGSDTGTDTGTGTDESQVVALLGTGQGNTFTDGQLFVTPPNIESDEAYSFELTIADPDTNEALLRSGQSVSFVSPCIDAGIASISGPTSPESGIMKLEYTSSGCYGEDRVHAFLGDSSTPAASGTIAIEEPETLQLALADYDPSTGSITQVDAIQASSTEIANHGQARLTVGIVDINNGNALQNGMSFTVNFESFCADGENLSGFSSASVTTTTGIAETIFTAGNCSQNPQVITATLAGEEETVSPASVSITVDETQAFQLVAALPEPMSIAPSFLSGEDRETVSTASFTLEDQNGDPLAFEEVTFTIDSAGTAEFVEQGTGAIVNETTATTDTNGVASVRVRAKEGVDHEEFRIIASYDSLTTYTMPIVVNSKLPYEPRFSLSTDNFAPNTWNINGVQSNLTLFVADINGNRVRGNTYVNFQIDPSQNHGSIDPDCVVVDGQCNITWGSLNTNEPYATIIASTHGRISETEIGTIETSITLLMSTNENVFLELTRTGAQSASGTEFCATAWVQLPDQGATRYTPPVGTEISFNVETGEFYEGAVESETIASMGELVLDSDGYEVCTTVKPEVNDTVVPNTYTIDLSATVQTPADGASETQLLSESWTD